MPQQDPALGIKVDGTGIIIVDTQGHMAVFDGRAVMSYEFVGHRAVCAYFSDLFIVIVQEKAERCLGI